MTYVFVSCFQSFFFTVCSCSKDTLLTLAITMRFLLKNDASTSKAVIASSSKLLNLLQLFSTTVFKNPAYVSALFTGA